MARTRNEELHDRRRAQILAAAADGFARKGIHQTTMQEICITSGISAGALYRYFPTKESIIVAFAEDERAETADLISHLARSANVLAALTEVLPALIDGLTDQKYGRLTLEVAAEATRNPSVEAAFEQNQAELRTALADALRRGQDAGHVDPGLDREIAVFLLVAIFDGIAGRAAFAPDLDKGQFARGIEHLLRRLFAVPAVSDGRDRGR